MTAGFDAYVVVSVTSAVPRSLVNSTATQQVGILQVENMKELSQCGPIWPHRLALTRTC